MNISVTEKQHSSLKLVGLLLIFLILGVAMISWPIFLTINLYEAFSNHKEIIEFEEGVYYLFGGGLFFIVMSMGSGVAFLFKKDYVATTYIKIIVALMGLSLVLFFVLPSLAHSYADDIFTKNGYSMCESKSRQWLFVRTFVYSTKQPCD